MRWTATHASFSLSPIPKAFCLLLYPITSPLMPKVAELGSRPTFMPTKLRSFACLSHNRIRVTHMSVQVTHINATCTIVDPIPLAPLMSFETIGVGKAVDLYVFFLHSRPVNQLHKTIMVGTLCAV